MIHGAKRYLYITTPYLICDHELLSALRIAAKKGVDVRIITPHIPDKKAVFLMTRSNYRVLIQDGVKIYESTVANRHHGAGKAAGLAAAAGGADEGVFSAFLKIINNS